MPQVAERTKGPTVRVGAVTLKQGRSCGVFGRVIRARQRPQQRWASIKHALPVHSTTGATLRTQSH